MAHDPGNDLQSLCFFFFLVVPGKIGLVEWRDPCEGVGEKSPPPGRVRSTSDRATEGLGTSSRPTPSSSFMSNRESLFGTRSGTRLVTGHEASRVLRIVRRASEETRGTRQTGQVVSRVFNLDHERGGSSHCDYPDGTTRPRTRLTSTVRNLGGPLTHSGPTSPAQSLHHVILDWGGGGGGVDDVSVVTTVTKTGADVV